jgi:hypothetical protein
MHVPYVVASAEASGGHVVELHFAKVEQQWIRHSAGERHAGPTRALHRSTACRHGCPDGLKSPALIKYPTKATKTALDPTLCRR